MSPGVAVVGEANPAVGSRGRSRRETESEQGAKSAAADPKPGELPMGRVKVG